MGMPTRIVATIAEPKRSIVLGSRHDISSATDAIVWKEKPKFHVNKFLMYLMYRICKGSRRPYNSSRASFISGEKLGSTIPDIGVMGDTIWNITKFADAIIQRMRTDTTAL